MFHPGFIKVSKMAFIAIYLETFCIFLSVLGQGNLGLWLFINAAIITISVLRSPWGLGESDLNSKVTLSISKILSNSLLWKQVGTVFV